VIGEVVTARSSLLERERSANPSNAADEGAEDAERSH
jgi:hypothetical protein